MAEEMLKLRFMGMFGFAPKLCKELPGYVIQGDLFYKALFIASLE